MNKKVDIKSVLLGLAAGILVMIAIESTAYSNSKSSSEGPGRYQISATGNHGLVLDTKTGQVWTGYFSSSGGKTDGKFYSSKLETAK